MRDHHTHIQKGHATSGGRTRHVVNLVKPGTEGTVAYHYSHDTEGDGAGTSAPSAATDGYVNFGLNKTLHAVFVNDDTGSTHTFTIWGYHSFSQQWGKINLMDIMDGSHAAVSVSVADGISHYLMIPIEGIERIYVQKTDSQTIDGRLADDNAKHMKVWLGVNTI